MIALEVRGNLPSLSDSVENFDAAGRPSRGEHSHAVAKAKMKSAIH
jgi:hypothetical protein